MGFLSTTRQLAGLWAATQKTRLERRLQNPETRVDSGGTVNGYTFDGQEIDHGKLREIKEIRESGGLVAQLVRAKALMYFGTGVEFHVETEDDEDQPTQVIDGEPVTLQEWLEDTFNDVDGTVLDIGEDAIWYPYGACEITETRGGDFGGIVGVEPWTLVPETDATGEIVAWVQETRGNGQRVEQRFEPEDIKHFVINKRSARDEIGISQVLRSEEEITQFKENQRAMRNAIEMHGFPEWHVKAGREGGAPLDDTELRRIIQLFEDRRSNGDTVTATGPDVELERMDPGEIALEEVTSNDLQQLAIALGVPIEAVDFGSEGLGSGEQSKTRQRILKLDILATQRAYMNQWVEKIIRPVIEQYSPFDHTVNLEMRLEDPLMGNEEMADLIQKVGSYMQTNEAREKLDLPPKEDVEGEYGAPADDGGGGDGGLDQIFNRAAESKVESALESRDLGDPTRENHQVDPGEGVGYCENTGKEFECETMGQLAGDCPHCGDPISHIDQNELSDGQGDTDFSHYEPWERALQEMHRRLWDADGETRLLNIPSFSETPAFVKDRIRETILSGGGVFSDIDGIADSERMQLRNYLTEELADSDGWTIDGVADRLMDLDSVTDRDYAELVARTETSAILNKSRLEGYEDKGQADDSLFYWSGNIDDRTTEACEWLINETNPFQGGDPVTLERLKELIEEAPEHDPDMSENLARPDDFVVHPRERKTFVRAPPDMA